MFSLKTASIKTHNEEGVNLINGELFLNWTGGIKVCMRRQLEIAKIQPHNI